MSEQEVYRRFINWLNQTWWGLPEADELMPLIMARYTPEEAVLLTGMPFSGKNLKCPTKSLLLERREVRVDPPKDVRDYMKRFMADRQAKSGLKKR